MRADALQLESAKADCVPWLPRLESLRSGSRRAPVPPLHGVRIPTLPRGGAPRSIRRVAVHRLFLHPIRSMPHIPSPHARRVARALLALVLPAGIAACTDGGAAARADDAVAASADAPAPAAAPAVDVPAPAAAGATPGRWSGEATGGYKGNRISFVVSDDGSRISDVTFEGTGTVQRRHRDDHLRSHRHLPGAGRIGGLTSVDRRAAGVTATRFVMEGRMEPARAAGTLRINLNALGCDTGEPAVDGCAGRRVISPWYPRRRGP